ncbi:MAG: glycoside hydrolase family 16 protein [Clostridiales bacterium]|nr:glycoside hydrolase family 16 protein [Clostridiales bacterium]
MALILILCSACSSSKEDTEWKNMGYDLSVPQLGSDGWYMVFEDDFNGAELNSGIKFGEGYYGTQNIWTTSPHAIRWESDDESKPEQACWWCPNAVSIKDGNLIITSKYENNHKCDGGCPSEGRFTGGIETREIIGDDSNNKGSEDELLFSQAYGYFEVRAKLPDADGLWSAFWLQSSNQRKPAAAGVDGTEIDVFESAFRKSKTSKMGHALLWNGYGKFADSAAYITNLEQNLYDGYHTYALKWTPEYYVFYIDGKPTWASSDGGVSHVKEYLRLTVEIDAGDGWGPHGQKIGQFDENGESEFCVDYVKVWQNSDYEQYVIDDSKFAGTLDTEN